MKIRKYILTILCCSTLAVCAQTADERYRAIYDAAEQDYNIGRLEQAEKQLSDNLKKEENIIGHLYFFKLTER